MPTWFVLFTRVFYVPQTLCDLYMALQYWLFLEMTCPSLTELNHAVVSSIDRFAGRTVTITCNPGYHIGGSREIHVICLETAEWSVHVEGCQRKKIFTFVYQIT